METTGGIQGSRPDPYLEWAKTLSDYPPRIITLPWTTLRCVTFDDQPAPGWQVALTHGIAVDERDEPDGAGNELLLCVHSTDEAWLYALMQMADQRRGTRLEAGMTDVWSVPLADDTAMTGFVLWHPIALPAGVAPVVHLPDRHVVVLQAFPLHEEEVARLRQVPVGPPRARAAKQFLVSLEDTVYQPSRPPRAFSYDDNGD